MTDKPKRVRNRKKKDDAAPKPDAPQEPTSPQGEPKAEGKDGFDGPPESNRTTPAQEGAGIRHGAKPHRPLTPAQVEAIGETLDRIADLEADLGPARKKAETTKETAEKAKKAVDALNADRKKLLDHLVEIRSGSWQTRIPLGE